MHWTKLLVCLLSETTNLDLVELWKKKKERNWFSRQIKVWHQRFPCGKMTVTMYLVQLCLTKSRNLDSFIPHTPAANEVSANPNVMSQTWRGLQAFLLRLEAHIFTLMIALYAVRVFCSQEFGKNFSNFFSWCKYVPLQ